MGVAAKVAHRLKNLLNQSVAESENNSGSNDVEENGSIGLNAGDGSDNGSGTQVLGSNINL